MQVHDVAGESTVCVRSYSSGESIVYRISTVMEGATTFFVVNNESETLPQYRYVVLICIMFIFFGMHLLVACSGCVLVSTFAF